MAAALRTAVVFLASALAVQAGCFSTKGGRGDRCATDADCRRGLVCGYDCYCQRPGEAPDLQGWAGAGGETFYQAAYAAATILWVIDDSLSMNDVQESLRANAGAFVDAFVTTAPGVAGAAISDWWAALSSAAAFDTRRGSPS